MSVESEPQPAGTNNNQSSLDEAILQQVPSMCDLLGIKRLRPKSLFWQETVQIGVGRAMNVPVDYLYVGRRRVTLAKRMQGVLTPEEWRPLIGSILLVRLWARGVSERAWPISIGVSFVSYAAALVIGFQPWSFLGTISGGLRILLFIPLLPLVVWWLAFMTLNRHSAYGDVLVADLEIARTIGQNAFLAVLQKIENRFNPLEVRNRVGSMAHYPTVQVRIRNLQAASDDGKRLYL